jgi:uncharacterized membrane protein
MDHPEKLKELKTLTLVVYALQAAGFILGGITWIVAVVINYVKREEVAGTCSNRTYAVWIIYRIGKGGLNLNDGKPMA